ncbi:MAG: mannonate dehydratase [Roseobacter sp.]
MLETWRWFGPDDPVSLAHVRQAGALGVVTALHEMPPGAVWTCGDIAARRNLIAEAGLRWSVVESIPVHPAIKLGNAQAPEQIAKWIKTMENLTAEGLEVICYNFMPVVDWTRTDLRYPGPKGGLALRFDPVEFAAYDVCILAREGAETDYDAPTLAAAKACFAEMDDDDQARLEATIIAGLPGSELSHGRRDIRAAIAEYDRIDAAGLRANLITFLQAVTPAAEACGARICLHPDDPPFSIFGLPRVVSTQADYAALFDAVPALANGITLCAGSLGSRADNDVMSIAEAFADRIHFTHLRNVTIQEDGAFFEDDHLDGGVDMVTLTQALMLEEARRRTEGRQDAEIPMRPDHGHLLIDDITKTTNPGYSAIGRLKGLAELRGIARAISTLGTSG